MRKTAVLQKIVPLLCAVGLFSVAACGGGGGSSTSSTAAGPGPTGSVIKIGIPAEFTGPNSGSTQGMKDVADAWQKSVNAEGGISGHRVEIEYGDSGGQPAKGSQVVRDLVESQGVVALAGGHDTSAEAAYASYLQSKGVPNVGGSGYGAVWTKTPMYFPLGMAGTTSDSLVAKVAIESKAKVVGAVVCAEVPQCAQLPMQYEGALHAAGVKTSETIPVAAAAPSHTAECLSLQRSGAQLVLLALASTVGTKFVEDCTQQGVTPTYLYVASSFGKSLTTISGLKAKGLIHAFPWFIGDPRVAPFNDMMKKYGDPDGVVNPSNTATYSALEYVKKAIETQAPAATATVSSKTVLDGIYALKNEDLGGLLAEKFTFTPTDTNRTPKCMFQAEVQDGKLQSPTGLTPICGTGQ